MFEVIFEGGISRESNCGCNYMVANCKDRDGDEVELYAEYLAPEGDFDMDEFDAESYPVLKAEIIAQAKEQGVSVDSLDFATLRKGG